MNSKYTCAVAFLLLAAASVANAGSYLDDRELFQKKCTPCHTMENLLWPRSYKAWQLIVVRMRTYTFDENGFSKKEGERIARFLSRYTGEGVILNEDGTAPEPEVVAEAEPYIPPQPVEAAVEKTKPVETVEKTGPSEKIETTKKAEVAKKVEVPEKVEVAKTTEVAKKAEPTKTAAVVTFVPQRRFWNPSREWVEAARVSGFIALGCLICLLITGFISRRLEGGIRQLHTMLALGLFLSLAMHGLINIIEYGGPNVLWYWFGVVAFLALAMTQIQGLVRKRFKKGLLIWHATGACVGLLLTVLHWVWAWL